VTPPLAHLLETSLYVADLDRSRGFYERVFGLPVLLQDARMCALALPASAVLLLFRRGDSLQPSEVPGGVIPPHGGEGVQHVAFAMPLAQLDAWAEHLSNCGVPIESRVTQSFGGVSLYFRDPDGHSVEIATPGLWANW
jgi:catechol 2,3-dioxygenase-like lactoylglutathione lyase family enzyme